MKLSGRNVLVSGALLLLLLAVILFEIAIFISGPMRKQESKEAAITDVIRERYKYINTFERHSFRYVVYVGEAANSYYFFDANVNCVLRKSKRSHSRIIRLRMQRSPLAMAMKMPFMSFTGKAVRKFILI